LRNRLVRKSTKARVLAGRYVVAGYMACRASGGGSKPFQHRHQVSGSQFICHDERRQQRNAPARQAGNLEHTATIGTKHRPYRQPAIVAGPAHWPAETGAGMSVVQQRMVAEIVGCARPATGFEVGRACTHQPPDRADLARHKRGRVRLAQLKCDVEAFFNRVHETVIEIERHFDVWMQRHELTHRRCNFAHAQRGRGTDLHKAAERIGAAACGCFCFRKLADQCARAFQKDLSGLGQRHGPGGPFEQLGTEVILQRSHQP
jgi:hypothetical protein